MKINRIFTALFLVIAFMFSTVTPVLAASPTAAITYNPTGPYKSGTLVTITATFSEPMADSPVPQISISGVNTLPPTNMTKVSPSVYTYDFTVGSGNGTATVAIPTGMNLSSEQVVSTPTSGANFTVDNTPPAITVTTFPTVNNANKTSVTLAGACENGLAIDLAVTDAGSAHSVNATPTCSSGAWTASSLDLSSLNDGTLTATANQTDTAGNIGTGIKTATKDVVLPVITVTTFPTVNNANKTAVALAGACENGLAITLAVTDVGSAHTVNATPICSSGAWTASSLDLSSLNDGTLTATAHQTDSAGNIGTGIKTASKDTIAPTVTFDLETTSDTGFSSTDNITKATSPIIDAIFNEPISGLASADLTNTGTAAGCSFFVGAPTGNTYPVLISGCSEGTLILNLKAGGVTDSAGNLNALTAGLTVTLDQTAPTLTTVHIQSNNANPAWAKVGDTITVSFTSSENISTPTVTIAGHPATLGLTGPTTWSATYVMAGSDTLGIVSFNISSSDLAGNTGLAVSTTTDLSSVTFAGGTAPTLTTVHIQSNNANTARAKVGDTVTVSFTSSASIFTPTVTIAGHAATIGLTGPLNWSATYVMAVPDTEGTITFNIAFTDLAGNAGIPVSTTTDLSSVSFDRTAPAFSSVAPASNAFITNITTASAVSYTLSEAITSGTITMTRTGGTTDSGSPHVCTLVGTALTIGAHNNLDLSNITNGCSAAQSLVSGSVYSFAFNGTDSTGNVAATVTNTNITFDTTAPIFSAVAPAANAFIKSITTSSAVSYTLSEALASGTITITRTGGSTDLLSPHTCMLIGTALTIGAHNHLDLSNTTNGCSVAQSLVSGAVYTFAFNGTDLAGNTAATVTSLNVTFDNTAPAFSNVSPATNAFISNITTNSAVSYTLNESIASGSITMTRTGGSTDPGSPHICTLVGTALNSGVHSKLDLSNTTNGCTVAQSLVNGGVYTFTFNALDVVGFTAPTVTSTNVSFDTTPPAFSAVSPAANSYIMSITTSSAVSYTLSKAVTSGSITMTRTGGAADAGSPHICTLTGMALSNGAHTSLDLSDTTNACTVAQSLVSGVIYTFAFNATDAAGNSATTVTRLNLTFDNAAPVFSSVEPESGAYINNITTTASDVGYTLNEAIASGTITITRTGGAADSGSPHTCTLTGTALSFGAHNPLDLSDTTNSCTVAQTLVSGSIYTFTFNATDPVGLTAATITKTNVTYDITFPTVSWTAPVGNAERYDVADQSVTLTVNASDNLGISRVVFSRWDYQNSVRVELGRATTPPYTITFNTSSLLPQYNEIDAKAYDLADNATLKYIWLFHLPVLHVVRAGPGNGKVTSSPTGIDCGSTCSYGFNYDPTANPPVLATTVTLTATPISPSTFAGWSGACSGTGTCTVTMDAARYVTANFADPRLRIFIPLLIR